MVLIALNAAALGLETSPSVMRLAGPELEFFDRFVIVAFCVEIGLRLAAHGLGFFRNPWGVFDFLVVAITLAPSVDSLSVLRSLRALRALRLVSAAPRLRRVTAALLHAVPGVAAIGTLLLLVFYVYAVMTTTLYGPAYPEWFGSIGKSMFSLFQIMTLESWSMGIVRPVLQSHPWAWVVFVSFIVISSFTVLNLFIAVVVDSMQTMHAQDDRTSARVQEEPASVTSELRSLALEVRSLREEITRITRDRRNDRPPRSPG